MGVLNYVLKFLHLKPTEPQIAYLRVVLIVESMEQPIRLNVISVYLSHTHPKVWRGHPSSLAIHKIHLTTGIGMVQIASKEFSFKEKVHVESPVRLWKQRKQECCVTGMFYDSFCCSVVCISPACQIECF